MYIDKLLKDIDKVILDLDKRMVAIDNLREPLRIAYVDGTLSSDKELYNTLTSDWNACSQSQYSYKRIRTQLRKHKKSGLE